MKWNRRQFIGTVGAGLTSGLVAIGLQAASDKSNFLIWNRAGEDGRCDFEESNSLYSIVRMARIDHGHWYIAFNNSYTNPGPLRVLGWYSTQEEAEKVCLDHYIAKK